MSQDGNNADVKAKVLEYQSRHTFDYINYNRLDVPAGESESVVFIARHYQSASPLIQLTPTSYALQAVFSDSAVSHAILLEDGNPPPLQYRRDNLQDLVPSPDFLTFFDQTAHLLDHDPTIWCISSWNDNGFSRFVPRPSHAVPDSEATQPHSPVPKRIFPRPGLDAAKGALDGGLFRFWIILIAKLEPKFPFGAWDHWMRVDDQHKGRECVVPEVSRNRNIGKTGASGG